MPGGGVASVVTAITVGEPGRSGRGVRVGVEVGVAVGVHVAVGVGVGVSVGGGGSVGTGVEVAGACTVCVSAADVLDR
jgi:hypothetical protein